MLTQPMTDLSRTNTRTTHFMQFGMAGNKVRSLGRELSLLGYLPAGSEPSIFDERMQAAVRRFQVKGVGANGRPLIVDGVVGAHTRFALDLALGRILDAPNTCLQPPSVPLVALLNAGEAALKAALDQIEDGAQEIGTVGGGPYCALYLKAAGKSQPQDWSSAFVAWCLGETGIADAAALRDRARALGWATPAPVPSPGDVLIWTSELGQGFCGHAAIVVWFADRKVYTVEGGRTPFVEFFHYNWSDLAPLITVVRPHQSR
jgi:peptidoglycan hydrolase-like protein with peptidoglycan-binding domain